MYWIYWLRVRLPVPSTLAWPNASLSVSSAVMPSSLLVFNRFANFGLWQPCIESTALSMHCPGSSKPTAVTSAAEDVAFSAAAAWSRPCSVSASVGCETVGSSLVTETGAAALGHDYRCDGGENGQKSRDMHDGRWFGVGLMNSIQLSW